MKQRRYASNFLTILIWPSLLWVVGRGPVQLGALESKKLLPKDAQENLIPIRDIGTMESMKLHYFFDEGCCYSTWCERVEAHKMGALGKILR